MMDLLYTPFSPFSRKVLILAHERGLFSRLRLRTMEVGTHVPLQTSAHDELSTLNPLVKIPVLLDSKLGALYDSRVICEYLDELHDGARVLPEQRAGRWAALKQQAIADGVVDAALLIRFEQTRQPGLQNAEWIAAQLRRILQGLDALEAAAASLGPGLTIGQIAMAAALGYMDFRFAHLQWRASRPALSTWFDEFARRPSMEMTKPA